MSIGSRADRGFEQVVVFVNRHQHIHKEGYTLQVFPTRLTGSQQVDARIGAHRPVVVLARTVDTLEGFLMEQDTEVVTTGHFLHYRHEQEVVVVGQIGLLENRSYFKLVGSNFVVTGLDGNTKFQALAFEVGHEGNDTRRYRTEVMVFELLVLGTVVAHEGATGQHQVGTSGIERLIDEEIFLLPAEIREYLRHIFIEKAAHFHSGFVQGRDGFEQRCLVVECFSCI